MSTLEATVREGPTAVALSLRGELDLVSSAELDGQLSRFEGSVPLVVLDLRGVTFLDSSGLRSILAADSRARKGGWRLAVVRGPDAVHRVFELTLLGERLELVDDPGMLGLTESDAGA